MLYLILGEKTVWTLISWLHQKSAYLTSYCFKQHSWNSKCYILFLVKKSGPWSAGFTRNQLTWLQTVSNDTLEIVNVISYSWWKNSQDPNQLASIETSLSGRLHAVFKWYSWISNCYILLLVKKQSGPWSAGFTRNQLIWLQTVFKWYPWNSKCYLILGEKPAYSTPYCFKRYSWNSKCYILFLVKTVWTLISWLQ